MTRHPDELTWAKVSGGELGPWAWLVLGHHLRGCQACRERKRALALERTAFERDPRFTGALEVLQRRASAPVRPPSRSLRWAAPLALAAVAAGGVFVVTAPSGLRRSGVEDALRPKGGSVFVLYARHGEQTAPLSGACREGLALRALYRSARPYLLVLGVDGLGGVQTLFPMEGTSSEAIAPGEHLTPGSWVLDAAPGVQRFVAFFSARPVTAADAQRALREGAALPETERLEQTCRKSAP